MIRTLDSTRSSALLEQLEHTAYAVSAVWALVLGQIMVLYFSAKIWPIEMAFVGLAMLLLPVAAALLIGRWYVASKWLFVVGLVAMTAIVQRRIYTDTFVFLWVPLIGIANIVLGLRPTALICVLALVAIALAPASSLAGLLAAGSVISAEVLMVICIRFALERARSAESTFLEAQRSLEEARDQRLQLKLTQDDLLQVNRELERVSERLAAMTQVAEAARRAKEEFVANVSHELRTPLNMVIGFSEMITEVPEAYGQELPPRLLADIGVIQRNSEHLLSLVNDVLDLSQMDAGRFALNREWLDLKDVAEQAVLAVMPLFYSKRLFLKVEIAPDLPLVYCDRIRIRQVVLNLLSNAGRFTDRGGATIRVSPSDTAILISVTDTGPGIAKEDQKRVFAPFEQLSSTIDRRVGGSGLGLAISSRFVDLHGGTLELESELGQGTVISFSLPRQRLQDRGNAVPMTRWFSPYGEHVPRNGPSRAPRPDLLPRFVVVEEGNAVQRLLARASDEIELVVARDLGEATAEVARMPAQAVIVNGAHFSPHSSQMAQLGGLAYGTPVIAFWLPDRREAAERLGVLDYLVKPVTRRDLQASLERCCPTAHTILVVDDEPDALQLFGRLIASSRPSPKVLKARSGHQALAILRERQPDLVLLDLVMPEMNGYQVLREKAIDPLISGIPVVAVSGQDPANGPIASEWLTISRSGGLSSNDLIDCIEQVTRVLAPPDQLVRQASLETRRD